MKKQPAPHAGPVTYRLDPTALKILVEHQKAILKRELTAEEIIELEIMALNKIATDIRADPLFRFHQLMVRIALAGLGISQIGRKSFQHAQNFITPLIVIIIAIVFLRGALWT